MLDLDPIARAAELDRRSDGDAELRASVERLIAQDECGSAIDRGAAALVPGAGPDPRIGRTVGPFRLDAVLGEGGMGTVFRATRISGGFEQQVALKLIRGGVDGGAARLRFERERAILASLKHPDLVPLLDGGVSLDGAPWYAMPLIDGEPVTRWCDAQRLPLRARVALVARICDAVQVAHQALVVHRDLKPNNILVDAGGAPYLLDFGIAKLLTESDDATHTATCLMTPAYAAPEQIRGEPVSTATDVFALGVVLYEIACGQHPFADGEHSAFALQRAVVEAQPRRLGAAFGENTTRAPERAQLRQSSPARLRRELAGDLNRIVAKALAKQPQDRYGSAAALADDLRRWLHGEPVQATPSSLRYRAGKFLMRWRWPLAATALLALTLVAATVFSLRQARVARDAQRAAEANAQSAQASQRFIENVFVAAEPWRDDGRPTTALDLADRAFESAESELVGQPLARADLYFALTRMYSAAGNMQRVIESGGRAIALYRELGVPAQRQAEATLRTAYGYSYLGRIADAQRTIDVAAALDGLDARQRFLIVSAQALIHRDRGRFDLARVELERSLDFAQELPNLAELPFAMGDNARMQRRHADAAGQFLLQDKQREDDRSRGWRALMAIYRLNLLPEPQRRPNDLEFADQLEAERAAVWPDGNRNTLFTSLRAQLNWQHGERDRAAQLAREWPMTDDNAPLASDQLDTEHWLALSYILLAVGEHAQAALQFARVEALLLGRSDALDPRLLLARAGAACAKGKVDAALVATLANPPQPDYLGYPWLRNAPCPELRDSAAARHPDAQQRAYGDELRTALDRAAARMGECQNGARVPIGAACTAHAAPAAEAEH